MNESSKDIAVRLHAVAFRWPGGDGFRLEANDFDIGAGERVLLLGESGSGKSTLLSLVCGVVAPQRGAVEIDGTDLARLSSGARDRFRANNIGVIFQQFNLLPYATPLDNILLALRFAPERRRRVDDPRAEALGLAAALRLPEPLVTDAAAAALSVGQQQRVAVARALIGRPSLIVADEPTSSLDASAQAAFLDRLFAQVAQAGSTLLMVSHDERLGGRFDRVVELGAVVNVQRGAAA